MSEVDGYIQRLQAKGYAVIPISNGDPLSDSFRISYANYDAIATFHRGMGVWRSDRAWVLNILNGITDELER